MLSLTIENPRLLNVFSIEAGCGFLPELVNCIVSGKLLANVNCQNDPFALARLTILVPNQRTARALGQCFVNEREDRGRIAGFLPAILPLQDAEEDFHLFDPGLEIVEPADALDVPAAIPPLERQLVMTDLVLNWARSIGHSALGLEAAESLLVSATPADATSLARDLLALMDAVQREGVGWEGLKNLVPDEYGGYWQMTLAFLRIVVEHWPEFLFERGLMDPVARRNIVLEREVNRIKSGKAGPIIAAGSTGSIPASAAVLGAVASVPDGALVLPGLDFSLEPESWEAIGSFNSATDQGVMGHPQFGLKQLLERLNITRADVRRLGEVPKQRKARLELLSSAMRPAEQTHLWNVGTAPDPDLLKNVCLIEAESEQEEALAIAICLRQVVEDPDKTAALVTTDRILARRVTTELRRWGIEVDTSAGTPLLETPPVVLFRLALETLVSGIDPVKLLTLLKHPLAAFERPVADIRAMARFFELKVLRGPRLKPGFKSIRTAINNARVEEQGEEVNSRFDQFGLLIDNIEDIFNPLGELLGDLRSASLSEIAKLLQPLIEDITRDEAGSLRQLDRVGAGEQLLAFLKQLSDESSGRLMLNADQLLPFLATLLAPSVTWSLATRRNRIMIWGSIEARLLQADCMVLSGLNEGTWPGDTKTDPWLSRSMRAGLGLEAPERRIGLSAHDFSQAFGAREVVLTRAQKQGGEPSVSSRWLRRLQAVAGEKIMTGLRDRGQKYLDYARQVDTKQNSKTVSPPCPTPPVSRRPTTLSITEIETWVRDPYAIYARHILKLRELDPVAMAPERSQRGSLVHDILHRFSTSWTGGYDQAAVNALIETGKSAFRTFEDNPEVMAFWWPRFKRLAHWYVLEWEAERDENIQSRNSEIAGSCRFYRKINFTLKGRADRIDIQKDGGLAIVDFKTGQAPSARQVLPGFAPQLALGAAIARAGGFSAISSGHKIAAMDWVQVSGGPKPGQVKTGIDKKSGLDADGIVDQVIGRLEALIDTFSDPETPYKSKVRPMFEGGYSGLTDHLARVKEWSHGAFEDETE